MKESSGLLFHIMFLKKNILSSWAACTPSKLNFAELIRSPYPYSKNCLMLLSNPLIQNEHTSHIRRAIKTQHKLRQINQWQFLKPNGSHSLSILFWTLQQTLPSLHSAPTKVKGRVMILPKPAWEVRIALKKTGNVHQGNSATFWGQIASCSAFSNFSWANQQAFSSSSFPSPGKKKKAPNFPEAQVCTA